MTRLTLCCMPLHNDSYLNQNELAGVPAGAFDSMTSLNYM